MFIDKMHFLLHQSPVLKNFGGPLCIKKQCQGLSVVVCLETEIKVPEFYSK